MEIANTFAVQAPAAEVYDALVDLERVGPCIPGATVGPAGDDGAHSVEIAVKVGPMRMTYRGTVRIMERDDAARHALLEADVKEARGQGTARARMSMDVSEDGGAASVASVTEVEMTGRAAQMGKGIIEDVAKRLVADMAGRLSAMLAATPAPEAGAVAAAAPRPAPAPAPPVNGIGLAWRALWDRVRRIFARR